MNRLRLVKFKEEMLPEPRWQHSLNYSFHSVPCEQKCTKVNQPCFRNGETSRTISTTAFYIMTRRWNNQLISASFSVSEKTGSDEENMRQKSRT